MKFFSNSSLPDDSEEKASSEKPKYPFIPKAFHAALENMKSTEALSRYMESQAQRYPEEYREALQEYVKEKLLTRTGLMRHVSFFDPKNTKKLEFFNVVRGFMDLGFDRFSSFAMSCLVMGGGIMGTQSLKPPIESVHNLQHPMFHTGAFNEDRAKLKNAAAHDRLVRRLIDQIMMGRDELEEEDILAFADEIEKKHPVAGPSKIGQFALKQLQILAFNNLKTVCGDKLTKKDLIDFYQGTLFYAVAEPASVAPRVMALRS
ncbi:hypothetical protein Lnau_0188 [Legionella nautarum]|uniref:Uncharacterized protein n=1 Tax=Legionella nautarum TaxID=45070 RepID=A0A0W0X4D6_9GAMM|nr:caleosin family protein [Legionella nautarum]KTD39421.1 hypothetical protein Lnau_0188 [Legionella nautarum]